MEHLRVQRSPSIPPRMVSFDDAVRADRLVEELRRATAIAEAAEQRAHFLAEASALLGASLESEVAFQNLARLAVPCLADYCVLFEVDRAGEIHQVAMAHVDRAKEPLLSRLGALYRVAPDDPHNAVSRVVASGLPERRDRGPADDAALAHTPELRDLFDRLDSRSSLLLPLSARGQVVGLLLLATSAASRRYEDADLELGLELAGRAALAIDNARLYREAQLASVVRDRFLATLSHELRTPLSPVLAVVSSLEERAGLPADVRSALALVRRNVELEARLIDDLLEMTRIARGQLRLKPRPIDLREVIEHAIDLGRDGLEKSAVSVALDLTPASHRVSGDAPRLTQVFWNLLQNAVELTPEGGTITLRSRTDGAILVVEVKDDGIGIPADVLPRIFTAFEQGKRTLVRQLGGLGLGLSISRSLIELHGGTLSAASPGLGRGSTFTVRLPLSAAVTAPSPARTPAGGEASSLRLLLVEDHADTAEAMAELLRGIGYQVTIAGTIATALAEAASTYGDGARFELTISDLGLPDGSGLTLMHELASRYRLRGIAVSGYGTDEDVEESSRAGFAVHLTKPISLQGLRGAIERVLAQPG